MKKLIPFLLLSLIITISTFAQSSTTVTQSTNTFAQDKILKGTSVKILEIGKLDSYYSDRGDFVGIDATTLGEVNKNSSGFYSGTLETSSGRTCFFSNVKLSVNSSASTTKPLTSTSTSTTSTSSSSKSIKFVTGTIKSGTSLYVAEISPDDSYYGDRFDKVGTKGKVSKSDLTMKDDGYYAGDFTYDDGSTAYFYKAKFSKEPVDKLINFSTSTTTPSTNSTTTTKSSSISSNSIKFVTGDIIKGTPLYFADISPDDSHYSERYDFVGKRGQFTKSDRGMKDGGYYSGTFLFDDGSSSYFIQAKFSKEPVDKLVKPATTTTTTTKSTVDDYSDLAFLFGGFDDSDNDEWKDATNDETIKPGDKVEITAISSEDSYYDVKSDYIGKKGTAGKDIEFQYIDGGYGGTIKFETGLSPNFYLIKLKKVGNSSSSVKPTQISTTSSSSSSTYGSDIPKNTKVLITDVGPEDSFVSNKDKYIRKKGKAVDGLTSQSGGYYSGKVIFDDGTDAYFFNVKVTIIK